MRALGAMLVEGKKEVRNRQRGEMGTSVDPTGSSEANMALQCCLGAKRQNLSPLSSPWTWAMPGKAVPTNEATVF